MPTRKIISSTLNVNTVEDAIDVSLSPESVILVQNESDGTISLANAYTTVSVNKGGIPVNGFTVSILGVENCQASVNNTTKRIQLTQISTHDDIPYDNGYVSVRVTYEGQTYDRRFVFYVNLLGTWKESVVGDTKTEVARSLSYAYTQDGQGVQTLENLGSYIKSSTENISRLEKKSVSNNLILNGAFISGNLNWDNWGNPSTREIVTINGTQWMHIVSTTEWWQGYQQRHFTDFNIKVKAGSKYTISFRAYSPNAGTVVRVGFHWFKNTIETIQEQTWIEKTITTTDTIYSSTITVPTSPAGINNFNIMVGDGISRIQEFYITQIKFEEGEIATVWTENVQDTYSEIKQTAETIDLDITNRLGQTGIRIDGVNRRIKLTAENVEVSDSFKAKSLLTENESSRVYVSGGIISIESKIIGNLSRIEFGVDDSGNCLLNYYDSNGNFKYGLGPDEIFRAKSQSEEMRFAYYCYANGKNRALDLYDSEIALIHRATERQGTITDLVHRYYALISANQYFAGNYCNSAADAQKYDKKLLLNGTNVSKIQDSNLFTGLAGGLTQKFILNDPSIDDADVIEMAENGYTVIHPYFGTIDKREEGDYYVYYFSPRGGSSYTNRVVCRVSKTSPGAIGYDYDYMDKGVLNFVPSPFDPSELADPVYGYDMQHVRSGVGQGPSTLYINKSKLDIILANN